MFISNRTGPLLGGILASLALASISHAIPVASQVISYFPGGAASNGFQVPSAALGLPNPISDPIFGNSVLTPFNPPYLNSDIVVVGDGGQLTLKLSSPAPQVAGADIGVFVNNGLIDANYPAGQNLLTAGFFSDAPKSFVSVSQNGSTWLAISANPITFDSPSNYFADLPNNPSFNTIGGSQTADFSKPFTQPLSAFNGLDWAATLALLNGSAGGEWLDFSSTGLSEVNYVRFEVPSGANYRMVVDAVTAVPEPSSIAAAVAALSAGALRRRR